MPNRNPIKQPATKAARLVSTPKTPDWRPCWTPGHPAELAEQTHDRRQPHPRQRGRLAAPGSDHRQPGQQHVQVSLLDLLPIGAVLGGDPQRPSLVPEERPLIAQLADPALLA